MDRKLHGWRQEWLLSLRQVPFPLIYLVIYLFYELFPGAALNALREAAVVSEEAARWPVWEQAVKHLGYQPAALAHNEPGSRSFTRHGLSPGADLSPGRAVVTAKLYFLWRLRPHRPFLTLGEKLLSSMQRRSFPACRCE